MTDIQEALQFADKLYGSAMNVAGAAFVEIDGNWKRDPRVMAVTILCRTLSTFNAALILLRANQVMEARMLGRPLFENFLWIAALREQGGKFVKAMNDDDALNRKMLAHTTVELGKKHGADMNNEGVLRLRQYIKEIKDTYKNAEKLHVSEVAGMSLLALHYIDYIHLSLDPLHCSLTALGRHVKSTRLSDIKTEVNISVEPRLYDDETVKTIRLISLVSVAKLMDFERGQVSCADFIGITVLPRG